MLKSLLRDKLLLALIFLAVFIKILTLNEHWVERYYTYGFYPVISRFLRILLGWLPFSFGDLLYAAAFIYLLVKTWKFIKILRSRKVKEYLAYVLVKKLLRLVLIIYLVFQVFWGLNYSRLGIAEQLALDVQPYAVKDLEILTTALQSRLNGYAPFVDSLERIRLNRNKALFKEGIAAYKEIENRYPFLAYNNPSIKPSMFTHIGHFFGFTGYYNPFSGEAQIKTTAPFFIKPFVVCHEMAHQLGYGKENEANFVAFLVCKHSKNVEFRYSIYYDMYTYAFSALRKRDSLLAKEIRQREHPQVKKDDEELLDYLERSANPIEPYISAFYDEYLKANNQPKGKMTYNEVVAWLVAYQKKYGTQSL